MKPLGYRKLARLTGLVAALSISGTGMAFAQVVTDPSEVRDLIDRGEYSKAIEQARTGLDSQPGLGVLWNLLGESLFATGDLDRAGQAFERGASSADEAYLQATLNVALLAQYRGDRLRARSLYREVLRHYDGANDLSSRQLAAVAKAARELGADEPGLFRHAVRLYEKALTADALNVAAGVALGELLLSKYNNTEALETFRDMLLRDADYAPTLLGLARSEHFDHSSQAVTTTHRSLGINPNLVPARAFLARLHIESEEYDQAEREAKRALQTNPNSLETLAVLAAVHYIRNRNDEFEATVRRCLDINPRYADLYNTLAEIAVRNRLYRDAVGFARRAVEVDPGSWRGYGLLGLNQLRIGQMQTGRANLERAFAGDPFNVWIKNTLDLTDTLEEFEVVGQGRFLLVLHRDEASLLTPYLVELAERAYEHYATSYGYRPDALIRIELYPRHADFSVRTVGLAGIGLLGVSFGPVVALDSPSARPVGSFNWGSALWHELAHTFHLGMTRHRVPRWFSEGLSVHEEHRAKEAWGADVTPDFLKAYQEGKLLPVSELNNGFVRPSYPEQIGHSYYQASLVFAFIDERWGSAVIPDMLKGYRDGQSTPQMIRSTLNMSMNELDAAFDAYLRKRFEKALSALSVEPGAFAPENDFDFQMRTAIEALSVGDHERAETHLLRAQALFPEYAGNDSAYWHLARLYEQRDEISEAAAQLERMVAINSDHYEAHVKLARWRERLEDISGAAHTLTRAIYINPFDPVLHQQLARLHAESEQWQLAARERAAVVALNPVDMAEARYQLAYAKARAGDRRAAKREVLRALELAPSFPEALELLLELRAGAISSDASGQPSRPTHHHYGRPT